MHGRHIKKRGQRWHYYRNRPKQYEDVESRSVITFSLKTNNVSEAKLKAAQISQDLEKQWEAAKLRGVSLKSQSDVKQYAGAIATNQAHGFRTADVNQLSEADLLNRLRFLISSEVTQNEEKAVLGLIEKPKLSMGQAFEKFWQYVEDEWTGLSPDQKRCKKNFYLKSVRHFEEAIGSVALYDITRAHAIEFRTWWMKRKKEKGLKSCTANREIDSIRRLIRVIYDIDGYEGKNPFDRVRLKKDVKVRRSPISSETIENKILAEGKLDGLHNDFQLLVKLLINTGMRPIEAIGLELKDFVLDHEIPYAHVRQNSVRVLKTPHSERRIPLLGVSLYAAKELRQQGGWGKRLGKNMYATTIINRHFRANNTFKKEKQSFYSLRHWFQDWPSPIKVVHFES